MNSEELQSQTIRWLRFPLAVAVVFTHTVSHEGLEVYMSQVDYLNLSGTDVFNIIRTLISTVIARCARPCFFIFSGFLFFYKMNDWNWQVYFEKLKRRIKTLMVPYILWNLIPVVIMAFLLFRHFDGSLMIWMHDLWENGILKVFWNYHFDSLNNILGHTYHFYYPYNNPLWFIRDLIILVFLSPVIYYFLKKTKLFGVIILGICYYTQLWVYTPGFSINAFFFFSLGAFFSIHGKNMILELRKGWWAWLFVAIISMILAVYSKGSNTQMYYLYPVDIFIIAGSITTINTISWLLERDCFTATGIFVPFLSKASFFIFAAHAVFLLKWSKQLVEYIIKPDSVFFLTIKYFMAPAVCVSVCVCVYYIASKISPRLLKILTGSR